MTEIVLRFEHCEQGQRITVEHRGKPCKTEEAARSEHMCVVSVCTTFELGLKCIDDAMPAMLKANPHLPDLASGSNFIAELNHAVADELRTIRTATLAALNHGKDAPPCVVINGRIYPFPAN